MSFSLHDDLRTFADPSNRRSSGSVLSLEVDSSKTAAGTAATLVASSSHVVQVNRFTWRLTQALAVLAVLTLLALAATIIYYEMRPSSSSEAAIAPATERNDAACADFYQHTCGSWLAANPLAPFESQRQMILSPIVTEDSSVIEQILNGSLPSSPVLRSYYAACMDTDTISALSWTPLSPYFAAISDIRDAASYMSYAGTLLVSTGVSLLLDAAPVPDPINPNMTALALNFAGLTLPNPLFYTIPELVIALQAAVANFFSTILGIPADGATSLGQQIAILELGIAQVTEADWPCTMANSVHFTDASDLSAYNVSLDSFLSGANITFGSNPFNVYLLSPAYFGNLSDLFSTFEIEVLQAHAMWRVFASIAHLLDDSSSEISFRLQNTALLGQQQQLPRDQFCLCQANQQLGGLVDAAFINVTWSTDTLQQVEDMIKQLRASFAQSIQGFFWMDEATKNATALKLQQITAFVGGRPIIPGTESLTLSSIAFLENYLQLAALEQRAAIASLSSSAPPTKHIIGSGTDVNAVYFPAYNSINLYAGIVQPSIFNVSASPTVNLARLGVIIGHELTHGFDNNGRLYDGEGRMETWWTNGSISSFNNQTECIVQQYSSMFIRQGNSGGFIDGELTLGENIADFGGVHFAYQAYRNWLSASQPSWTTDELRDSDREFFTAYGQLWCTQSSAQRLQSDLRDVHSPYPARINGPLQMFPPFADAYECPVGSAMNPTTQCFVY